MPMPSQVVQGWRAPCAVAISADHTGIVAPSAVAAAAVVSLALGTQVAKCSARNRPAQTHSTTVRRSKPDARRVAATGPSTPTASALRQKAIASAGAAAKAISGADDDTAI